MWPLREGRAEWGDRGVSAGADAAVTDIVGSTDRLRDLGDAAWAALLARHHEVIRAVLAAHGGREVNTVGDGFLARFDAPAPAVRAAAGAVAGVAPLGVEIRVGPHAGEVELEGNEVAGVGVHLAARVMAEAGAGQVLVSSTVRDLLAGSGLGFVDLGVRELKGFAEHWRCSPSTWPRCQVARPNPCCGRP
jgi:class 3 adenylate cyclase